MTWTYGGAPGTSSAATRRDAVRLFIGDTDTTDQQVTDEEIAFALSQTGDSTYRAGAMMAEAIAAKYGRLVDVSVDAVRTSYQQRQKSYLDLATRLLRAAKTSGGALGVPGVGGVSVSEIDSVRDNTDRVEPSFRRRQFTNPAGDLVDEWWKQ